MTRIPYVRREELGPEGQQLWDGIVEVPLPPDAAPMWPQS